MQIIAIMVAFALLAIGIKPVAWNESYIEKKTTYTINGFFIFLVFLSHFAQYAPYVHNYVVQLVGQLIVVMFLFYSGYGCAMQCRTKGADYMRTFPQKRILTTLVNFDVAVAVFIIIGLLLGKSFTLKQVALSFVCWDSVGNSNWYIFAILLCYSAFWLVFAKIVQKVKKLARECVLLIILVTLVIGLSRIKEPWWYDTMMTFGAGVVYAMNKERLEGFIKRNYWVVLLAVAIVFFALPYLPFVSRYHFAMFNMKSITFALLVVLLTMKFELRSPALAWCGKNLFPLYIYQRIPMIVCAALWPAAFADWRSWIFFGLSAILTVGIALFYPKFQYSGVSK